MNWFALGRLVGRVFECAPGYDQVLVFRGTGRVYVLKEFDRSSCVAPGYIYAKHQYHPRDSSDVAESTADNDE